MTYRERPAAIFARGVFCALALGPLVSSTSMRSAAAAPDDAHAANGVAAELRAKTQRLLDAIAPGNVAVWEELLDPAAIQVYENDRVRGKAEILADLKPLPPGLVGHLGIDDFRVALKGEVAVVTHEDDEYLDYHGTGRPCMSLSHDRYVGTRGRGLASSRRADSRRADRPAGGGSGSCDALPLRGPLYHGPGHQRSHSMRRRRSRQREVGPRGAPLPRRTARRLLRARSAAHAPHICPRSARTHQRIRRSTRGARCRVDTCPLSCMPQISPCRGRGALSWFLSQASRPRHRE